MRTRWTINLVIFCQDGSHHAYSRKLRNNLTLRLASTLPASCLQSIQLCLASTMPVSWVCSACVLSLLWPPWRPRLVSALPASCLQSASVRPPAKICVRLNTVVETWSKKQTNICIILVVCRENIDQCNWSEKQRIKSFIEPKHYILYNHFIMLSKSCSYM
jgi:hypothetical protein